MPVTAVRHSRPEDLPRMLEIYAAARQFMREHGNPTQWLTYPEREVLERDIANGCSYVMEREDGEIAGTFVFVLGEDPTYAEIEGEWLNSLPYGTIHRIAGDGSERGILKSAVEYCGSVTDNIRLDTHENNTVMQNAALKLGFRRCGIIYVKDDMSDRSPRIAFQKTAEGE